MICPECKKECSSTDYLPNQEICYKCSYARKSICLQTHKDHGSYCKMCNKEIGVDLSSNRKQRRVYCSETCAKEGQKEMNEQHWTRIMKRNLPRSHTFYS